MTGMTIAWFGSSLVSAYWNGAATYYRGIIRALHERGHRITFYEPDAFDRQRHRDMDDPAWARVHVYAPDEPGAMHALSLARGADLVVKASGVGVLDQVLEAGVLALQGPGTRVVFWDVDAPATLDRLARDPDDPFRALVPRYDLVFTYGGGPPVVRAYRAFGARRCVPVYNALDPATHHPVAPVPAFRGLLGFLGNRLPDREARVDEFFLRVAARMPGARFVLGGSGWCAPGEPGHAPGDGFGGSLPANVVCLGHVYTRDHNAFNASVRAVLNINRDSMARYGFSPPTRVFEAAGAGACLITDAWDGIEQFLEPGKEVLVARSGDEVLAYLRALTDAHARTVGARARARILAQHTYARRALDIEQALAADGVGRLAVGSANCATAESSPESGSASAADGVGRLAVGSANCRAAESDSESGSAAGSGSDSESGSAAESAPGLDIVILGLSITSSWGNGHATTYRSLVHALSARGHRVLFLERDMPWYASHRDLPVPPHGQTRLYRSLDDLVTRFTSAIEAADLVVVGSYVPEGIAVGTWVTRVATGITAFYDIDTPVTVAGLATGTCTYLSPGLVPRYDLYLSFTGGPILADIQARYGAPRAVPLYCAVDPTVYRPRALGGARAQPGDQAWDLGYMGTYSADRQQQLQELLLLPAIRWPGGRFLVAGPQYPDTVEWPVNVTRIEHLSPAEHAGFYGSLRFALNITRRDMVRAGFSPSVRLFEAAACAVPILADAWAGLDRFFVTQGAHERELVVVRSAAEVLGCLRDMPEDERRAIGARARARVLAEHTADHRAHTLEGYVRALQRERAGQPSAASAAPGMPRPEPQPTRARARMPRQTPARES